MQSERALLKQVLPLWVRSVSLESPLTPFLAEIKEMCVEYARRIVERQQHEKLRQISLPKRGPAKIGTGVRQIEDGEVA